MALDADVLIIFDMDARTIELDNRSKTADVQTALAEAGYFADQPDIAPFGGGLNWSTQHFSL